MTPFEIIMATLTALLVVIGIVSLAFAAFTAGKKK
jgi:hypothetical protein